MIRECGEVKALLTNQPIPAQDEVEKSHFDGLPVEVVREIASKLLFPDLLHFRLVNKVAYTAIDSRLIESAQRRMRYSFKNMDNSPVEKEKQSVEFVNYIKKVNKYITHRFYDCYSLDLQNPDQITKSKTIGKVKCIYSYLHIDNSTTKYKDEPFKLCTGECIDGSKFLIAPRAYCIEEAQDETGKLLFRGSTNKYEQSAIYFGKSFNEIIKLIQMSHFGILSRHISRILEHEKTYF